MTGNGNDNDDDNGRVANIPVDDLAVPEGQPHTQYEETYGRPYYVPLSDDYEIEFIPTEQLTNGEANRDSPIDEEFVAGVHYRGIIAPIEVVEEDGEYTVFDGWRRRKAAVELGYETVPCRVWSDFRSAFRQRLLNNQVNQLMAGRMPDTDAETEALLREHYPHVVSEAEQ